MTEQNWLEKLRGLSRERLERFALNAMGGLMTFGEYTNKTPEEMFEIIFKIGEDTEEAHDVAS